MKHLIFILLGMTLAGQAHALARNNCDNLVNPNEEQLNNCFARFGKSPYRVDLERRAQVEDQRVTDEQNLVVSERSLLESRTFTRAELNEQFFGQTLIIAKVDRNDANRHRFTFEADLVCQYLGYTKAVDIRVPDIRGEIWSSDAESIGGIILENNLNFKPYRGGFFESEHLVKPLDGITCYRTKDGSSAPLRHLPSLVMRYSQEINSTNTRSADGHINDGPRNQAQVPSHYSPFVSGVGNSGDDNSTTR